MQKRQPATERADPLANSGHGKSGPCVISGKSATNSRWRLVVSDLDGTLLDEKNEISPTNRAAVAELARRGIGFTLATGRMDRMTRIYVRQLQISVPIIACNGAVIRDCATDAILSRTGLPQDDARLIIGWLEERAIDYLCYSADKVFYPENSRRIGLFRQYNEQAEQQGIEAIPLLRLTDYRPDQADDTLIKIITSIPDEDLEADLQTMLASRTSCAGVLSMDHAVDIMAAGVSKGQALLELSRLLAISPAEIAAIGDHDNDAPMLRAAGLGIAMGNATPAARAAGGVQTLSHTQSGVAEAIHRYILSDYVSSLYTRDRPT